MTSVSKPTRTFFNRVGRGEAHLFIAYALLTLRPGASPPRLPGTTATAPQTLPLNWGPEEYRLFIEEARLDAATQQSDKRDIRSRAQVILTTGILIAGALVTSYKGKHDLCWCGQTLYGLAMASTLLAILAAGGLISARSDIGTVSVPALTYYDAHELRRVVAEGYAATREIGAETVAVMVTVLRDCVLALVLGAALGAYAYVVL